MMVAVIISSGRCYRILALEETGNCEVLDFLNIMHEKNRKDLAKLVKVFDRIADAGLIQNSERFGQLKENIYEFRIARVRLMCFIDARNTVVLTNGFMKTESKSDLRHPESVKLRYYAAKANGYLTYREELL